MSSSAPSKPVARATARTSALFKSTHKQSAIVALHETIPYLAIGPLRVPAKAAARIRSSIALGIIRERQELDEKDDEVNVIAYILTVTGLLFPDFMPYMIGVNAGNFHEKRIALDAEAMVAAFESKQGNDDESLGPQAEFAVPDLTSPVKQSDWDERPEIVVGRWGVEMFCIGKNATNANLPGFRINRIRAIRDTYALHDEDHPALAEDVLPRLNTLISINRAFNEFAAIRFHFAAYWINIINTGETSRDQQAFTITFRLLDGAGLGAASFICDLLYSHPKLKDFPDIKSAVKIFDMALTQYMQLSEDTRGFVKVQWASRARLFAGTTRGALLALAVEYRKQTDATAGRFIDTTPFMSTLAKANKYLIDQGQPPITQPIASQAEQEVEENE